MGRIKAKRMARHETRRAAMRPKLVHVSGRVSDLLGIPPEEVARRHQGVPGPRGERLRAHLMDRVRLGAHSDVEVAEVLAGFAEAGTAPVLNELMALVEDDALPLNVRGLAFEVWAHGPDDQLELMPEKMRTPSERERLRWLLPFVAGVLMRANVPGAIGRIAILDVIAGPLPRLFELLEEARRQLGMEALTVYAGLLTSAPLARLHGQLLDAIVDEAAPDAHACLTWLRRTTDSRLLRAQVTRALTRLEPASANADVSRLQ